MSGKINLEYATFEEVHKGIEQAYENLLSVKASLGEQSSKSEAMSAFCKRVKTLEKLVGEYAELLGNDALAFYEAGVALVNEDKKQAKKYRAELYDARGVCPVEGGSSKSGGGSR